jgi:transcriptional regulator with XRE-family HTH domain
MGEVRGGARKRPHSAVCLTGSHALRLEEPWGLTDHLRRFGQELRRCRTQAGHSQTSRAEASGVAQSTISRIERGLAPRAAMVKLVALGAALDRRLPLAFCPHEHACVWERLDANGVPVRTVHRLDMGMWFAAQERIAPEESDERDDRRRAGGSNAW